MKWLPVVTDFKSSIQYRLKQTKFIKNQNDFKLFFQNCNPVLSSKAWLDQC